MPHILLLFTFFLKKPKRGKAQRTLSRRARNAQI